MGGSGFFEEEERRGGEGAVAATAAGKTFGEGLMIKIFFFGLAMKIDVV